MSTPIRPSKVYPTKKLEELVELTSKVTKHLHDMGTSSDKAMAALMEGIRERDAEIARLNTRLAVEVTKVIQRDEVISKQTDELAFQRARD